MEIVSDTSIERASAWIDSGRYAEAAALYRTAGWKAYEQFKKTIH